MRTLLAGLLFASCLAACDESNERLIDSGPADAGDATDAAGDSNERLFDSGPIDAAARDAARDAPAGDARPGDAAGDSGTVPCEVPATLEIERVEWRWWAHQAPPAATVGYEREGGAALHADSDAAWLAVAVSDAVQLRVRPGAVPAGRHLARITLRDGDCVVAELEVQLEAFLDGPRRKVLVVGADGVRSDGLAVAETPVLDALGRAGYRTQDASTQLTAPTVSGPGWASILTGVEPAKHRIVGNGGWENFDRDYRSFLHVARHDLGLRTAVAAQWPPIVANIAEPDAAEWASIGDQAFVTAAMAQRITDEDFDVHFIHLDDVDHAGHATGFSPENPDYLEAVGTVDEDVGELLDAILARPTLGDESWLVVFTSDHGGLGTGHGGLSIEHRRIPLLVTGVGVRPGVGRGQPSHLDVFPTVLAWLGQPTHAAWGIDGNARAIDFESHCEDGVDDDGDGAGDCDDPDCDPACEAICPEVEAEIAGTGEAVTEADTREAGNLGGASCGGHAGPERAFAWTAPATDVYGFNTIGADFDTALYVLDADCDELACNDHIYGTWRRDVPIGAESGLWLPLEAGQQVRVVIDGADAGNAPLAIHRRADACEGDADLEAQVEGDNAESPTRLELPCAGSGRDHVYRFVAPAAGTWRFDTAGSDFDTVLAVLTADCSDALACNDDAIGLQSQLEVDLDADQPVRVVVSGFRGRNGHFVLNAALAP